MKTTDDVKDLLAKRNAWVPPNGSRVRADVPKLRLVAGDIICLSGWTSREGEAVHDLPLEAPNAVRFEKLAQHWLEVWRAQDATARAERERKEREANEREMQATWRSCGVGPRFAGCTLAGYKPQNAAQQGALDACARWPYLNDDDESESAANLATAKGLWLIGPKGTGKTHLAAAVLRSEWFDSGLVPGMITHEELIDEIRATWNRDTRTQTTEAVIQKYGEDIDVLVLDDVGAVNNSEQARTDLFKVINRRYKNNLVTIITSNLSASELERALGDRIVDRLRDGAIVLPVTGASYRKPLEVSP